MANLPEWAKPHVTMEGWRADDFKGSVLNHRIFMLINVQPHSFTCVVVSVEGVVRVGLMGDRAADFGPDRLPEAIYHAETIARAIQAAQSAAEVQGG